MLQLIVAGLTVGAQYALVALGLHLILRATRVINFAQGEFTVLGGLLALTLEQRLHLNGWFALIGATVLGFAIGLAFEFLVLRPSTRAGETGVSIATIGAIFVVLYGHALVPDWGSVPQPFAPLIGNVSDTLSFGGTSIQVQSLMVLGLLLVALVALFLFTERTYFGKAIRAAADNPLGARLIGIDVRTTRAVSVGLGIALACYGGTIIGPLTLVGGVAGTSIAIKGFVAAIVGGLESPLGCVAGGLIVGVVQKLLEGRFTYELADPIVYCLLLLALLIRPQGLFGRAAAVRD
jgi:branched-chain amino acid transport system permease protein